MPDGTDEDFKNKFSIDDREKYDFRYGTIQKNNPVLTLTGLEWKYDMILKIG